MKKTHGILFKPAMRAAIEEGFKTVTRLLPNDRNKYFESGDYLYVDKEIDDKDGYIWLIWLKIISVTEEVLDIENMSDDECGREGVKEDNSLLSHYSCSVAEYEVDMFRGFTTPQAAFTELWNSINTKPGTRAEDHPNVLRIEFELVPPF